MPDGDGNLKGTGWSRRREQGWARAFAVPSDGDGTVPPEQLSRSTEDTAGLAPDGALSNSPPRQDG